MNDKPELRIVPSGTEAEVAAELKTKMGEKLNEMCAICDECDSKGFMPVFNLVKGPIGKWIISQLALAKHF